MSQKGGLPWIIDRMADSLTSLIQEQSDDVAIGQACRFESYVSIRWPWLTPLVLIVAFGAIFVTMAIFQNRKQGQILWKNSVMPFVYNGAERDGLFTDMDKTGGGPIEIVGRMKKLAKGTTVALSRTQADQELRLTRVS
jgi:hypothetical protein